MLDQTPEFIYGFVYQDMPVVSKRTRFRVDGWCITSLRIRTLLNLVKASPKSKTGLWENNFVCGKLCEDKL